jgi:hypothetical protein
MKKLCLLPLVLAFAATAQAETRAAQLLSDAPKMFLAGTPRLLDTALGAEGVELSPVEKISFGEHFAKTAIVGTATSVTGVLIGAGLGMLSNNLIAAAVPVLLANLFLPPIVTVLVAMWLGNLTSPGRFTSFWLPVGGAFLVNAAAYVIASLLLVVPWTNPAALLVYALVDGLLMSGASVGLMHLTEKKAPTVVTSFVPGVTDTVIAPIVKVAL